MNSLLELIDLVKKRPQIHLRRGSIFDLIMLMDGFLLRNPETVTDSIVLWEFDEWVHVYYHMTKSVSWADLIHLHSYNEYTALDTFFELFEEFLSQRANNIS